ncbi:MAG: diguanylate cyclase [Armatimonadota bacterium]|nr:diguanylate cyclase [Armatimonadota bacterium]
MFRKSKTSLEAKLCLLTMGLLFAVLLGVGHFAMSQQKKALVDQQRTAFQALARAIALAAEPVVSTNDSSVGQKIIDQLNQTDLDVEYIVVSDNSGNPILAHSRSAPHVDKKLFAGQARKLAGYVTGYSGGVENVYRTELPVRVSKDKWGTVAIGFSLGDVNRSIDELETSILLVFALALIVGILGSIMLARGISGQLRQLIATARDVAKGDLTGSVPESSSDEIGELSKTFNIMLRAIRDSHERLTQRANTDSLTDLHNHRYFQERLAVEISRASRYHHNLSVLMIDIDHFKNFNDRYGHPFGDRVLREIAQIMKAEMRDMDVIARYGGEEFAVILPETGIDDAYAAGERLRTAVQRHCFYGAENETVPMTISVGAGQYPSHSLEREGLIMAADMALYRAKSTGRNKTCRYEQELQDNPAADPYRVHVLLRATDLRTVEALSSAIDSKHRFPLGHGKIVANKAAKLGAAVGMTEEECDSARIAGLLRDIGQLALPDGIVTKPEPLSAEDREILASHPSLGHSIVQKSPGLKSMLPGILHHHESFDGSGYPFGLAGEDIPLVARVIAVVDSYCAMITDRPHRPKMEPAVARAVLANDDGHQFDSVIVKAFLKLLDEEVAEDMAA